MRRAAIAVVALLGFGTSVIAAPDRAASRRIQLEIPGRILDVERVTPERLAILIAPVAEREDGPDVDSEDGTGEARGDRDAEGNGEGDRDSAPDRPRPREVWLADLAAEPTVLRRIHRGDHRSGALRTYGEGENRTLWLIADGEALDLGRGEVNRPAVRRELPGVRARAVRTGGPVRDAVAVALTPGRLRSWSLTDPQSAPREIDLPLQTEAHPWGLRLSSPPVTRLGTGAGARWLVGPRSHGHRRLQTTVHGPDGDTFDAWAQLPEEEEIESSRYHEIDGGLYLLTVTRPKGGVFAKVRVSLFPVERDRTRSGVSPSFRAQLDCHFWHEPRILVRDEDGDGRADLLIAHPEGLGGGDLVLLRASGLGGGRFSPSFDRQKLDLDRRNWRTGGDFTGDGLTDLLLIGDDLEIRAGTAGRRLLERRGTLIRGLAPPSDGRREVAVVVGGDGESEAVVEDDRDPRVLTLLDVDGDGRDEILLRDPEPVGDRLVVVFVP